MFMYQDDVTHIRGGYIGVLLAKEYTETVEALGKPIC